jgi:deoxyribonuclease V
MQPLFNHSWDLTPTAAIALQKTLAQKIKIIQPEQPLRFIAGVDCAPSQDKKFYFAAVVLWDRQQLRVLEYHIDKAPLVFPYIPGLLSFREIPAILKAFAHLTQTPDVIMVDGHGLAHPRGLGIASHLGLLFERPTLGCGKSLLYGHYQEPGLAFGATSSLVAKNKVIGMVVRTRAKVAPVIVSVGHLIDLPTAVDLVLDCTQGYRLPEPTRQADKLVALKKETSSKKT